MIITSEKINEDREKNSEALKFQGEMSLLWTLLLKIGYLKTKLQLTIQIEIDNLISQLICCKTCIPSTVWWRRLRNWEILSTIYETTSALPAVPLKVRWWVTIYGTRIRGTTSFLYLMNMRAFAGYIWVICPEKIQIIRQNSWMSFSGIIWFFFNTGGNEGCCFESVEIAC